MTKPLLTFAVLEAMVPAETESITVKAVMRTAAWAETFFPIKGEDKRDPKVIQYVQENFQNPDSPLFDDSKAAALWATLEGIEYEEADYQHLSFARATSIPRGVCLVVQDGPYELSLKDTGLLNFGPLMSTQQGSRQPGRFRNAEGKKILLPTEVLNTINLRPATRSEIDAIVAGNMAVRPNEFIRNMGDSLETNEDNS